MAEPGACSAVSASTEPVEGSSGAPWNFLARDAAIIRVQLFAALFIAFALAPSQGDPQSLEAFLERARAQRAELEGRLARFLETQERESRALAEAEDRAQRRAGAVQQSAAVDRQRQFLEEQRRRKEAGRRRP